MTALSVTVTGENPAELATRLRALADALTSTGGPATGGLPDVPSTPAPRVCPIHSEPLRFDEWQAKSGKACKAWRCPSSTPETGCPIEWAS